MARELPEPQFRPLILGALPHGRISRKLNIPLAPGVVHFTIPAQKHAFKRHPQDFHVCFPYLSQAINHPTYVGQAPQYQNAGFEVVLTVPAQGINVLVAITLLPSDKGVYHVDSVYLIDKNKVSRRLRMGYLVRA